MRNLVDINKVYRALVWLKNNNEFYKDIDLPSRPELLFTSLPDHQIPSYSNNLEASHDKGTNPEQTHNSFDKSNVCPVHTKEASNQSTSSNMKIQVMDEGCLCTVTSNQKSIEKTGIGIMPM